jgi:hypothetical protein
MQVSVALGAFHEALVRTGTAKRYVGLVNLHNSLCDNGKIVSTYCNHIVSGGAADGFL